ncbi:MAG: dehydrogenase, partial [Cyclobacteriaceae bacterium]
MKTQNRRNFVKTSTTMAVGSTLLSGFSINAMGASKPNELRVGLVGCGGRGTGAAFEALKTAPNVKLTAMADAFEDRVESSYMRLSNEFGDQVSISKKDKHVGFEGYKKVIEKCDVVILATPPPFRPIHFEAAVKADKHV